MQWKKAGRPRLSEKEEDKPWTKEEQAIYSDATVALACAVVKQWKKDGSPASDWLGVLPWLKILEEARHD